MMPGSVMGTDATETTTMATRQLTGAAQVAATVRAELKAKGIEASVRTRNFAGGSAVDIELHDAARWHEAHAVAKAHESVRRCELTGETLAGGNRYVQVHVGERGRQAADARWADALRAAADKLRADDSALYAIDGAPGLFIGRNSHGTAFQLWGDRMLAEGMQPHDLAVAVARELGRRALEEPERVEAQPAPTAPAEEPPLSDLSSEQLQEVLAALVPLLLDSRKAKAAAIVQEAARRLRRSAPVHGPDLCPICDQPCHATEGDSVGRHPECLRRAQAAPAALAALEACERCPGIDTTDQTTGATFRDTIHAALRAARGEA